MADTSTTAPVTTAPALNPGYSSAAQSMYSSLSPAQQATLQKGSPEMFSPTVVSDASIHNSVIPGITQNANNNVNALTPGNNGGNNNGNNNNSNPTGGNTDNSNNNGGNTGGTDYSNMSYGDIYKSVYGDVGNAAFANPQLQSEMNLIQQAGQGADAATRASLAAVQAQYQNEYANTVGIQASTTAGVEQSLNLGGSSRYAPISSAGIMDSKTRYDLQTLQGLSATNASNVAKLQQAIADNDFKTAQSMNDLIDKTREQSQTLAASIASGVASQAKDTRDRLATAVSDAASTAQMNDAASKIQASINV